MDCEEVRLNLLAYLDGEVSEDERTAIEAHVADCDQCAAELARLQALQADLWDAIPAGLESLRLPEAASARIQARLDRARGRQVRGGLLETLGDLLRAPLGVGQGALVKVAIPVLTLIAIVVAGLVGRQPAAVRAQETIVILPQTLAPDTEAALRIIVRQEGTAAPIADAELEVYLRMEGGETLRLYSGQTGGAGSADVRFHVPDSQADRLEANLIVTARSLLGEDEVVRPVEIRRSYRLYLGSDKPLYQPGQTLHLRVLALDAGRNRAAAGRTVEFEVLDPEDRALLRQTARTSAYGIAWVDHVLSEDAEYGEYRLRVTLGDTRSERTVTVGRYERPPFRVELDLARPYYLAGETVEGVVRARQLDGAALGGAEVLLRAYLHNPARSLVATLQGRADADGVYRFRFSLPDDLGTSEANPDAQLVLEARVSDDQGRSSWSGRVMPAVEEPLSVDLVAEDGRLRPGVENQVYLLVSTPDGAPVQAEVSLEAQGRQDVLSTDAHGLATWSLTPDPGVREVRVQVTARDALGRSVNRTATLSADQGPAQVLLRLDRASYRVGESMQLEVLAGQGEIVYVDVVQRDRGQTVSTHVARLDNGQASLAVDVSPQMVGALELHAYQVLPDGSLARDSRVAVVEAASSVAVDLRADQEGYHPGDPARVTVGTTSGGWPVQSALGIAVVDESIYALEERAPGFARLFFALDQGLYAAPGGDEAQDRAARAAWAGLPAGAVEVARSFAGWTAGGVQARRQARMLGLAWGLGVGLLIAATGVWVVALARLRAARGERAARKERAALWRTVLLLGALTALLLLPITVGLTLWLWAILGAAGGKVLLVLLLAAWLAVLIALAALYGQQRDDVGQIGALLVAAYGVLAVLLGWVVAQGVEPGPGLSALVVLSWAGMGIALVILAAALWRQGRRALSIGTVALILLAVALALLAGLLVRSQSLLARTLSDPRAYVGPVGWLSGCATAPRAEPVEKTVEVEKEVEKVVKETVIVKEEVEVTKVVEVTKIVEVTRVVEKEVTKEVEVEVRVTATPTPAPSAQPMPTPAGAVGEETTPPTPAPGAMATPGAATPATEPGEQPVQPTVQPTVSPEPPLPLLGQVAAETIYWAPEAITDAQGQFVVEFPLPAVPATWRMTVLASTVGGELGEADLLLPVYP